MTEYKLDDYVELDMKGVYSIDGVEGSLKIHISHAGQVYFRLIDDKDREYTVATRLTKRLGFIRRKRTRK